MLGTIISAEPSLSVVSTNVGASNVSSSENQISTLEQLIGVLSVPATSHSIVSFSVAFHVTLVA